MSKQDSPQQSLSYKDAGVDIDAGHALVERIKSAAQRTHRPGVLGGLGGFGGLFQLPGGYQEPVLVSGTDGVGTKLRLAIDAQRHDGIGIDLVAMCVNDIVVAGAEPLFFLDYYATGQLNVDVASEVVGGIGRGCEMAGCALVGGETAEMPGMYQAGDYDLAGFAVGIVEKSRIIDGSKVAPGDLLVGLPSSGPHANGYSLIRKVLEHSKASLDETLEGKSLADWLLAPTRIYVKPLLKLIQSLPVHALSHITGGGLLDNIPRVLPANAQAVLNADSWELPPVFKWLQQAGNISDREMQRTFNCGIGMVLVVSADNAEAAVELLRQEGEEPFMLGHIRSRQPEEEAVVVQASSGN